MAITPTAPYNFVPLIGKLPLIRYPFSEDGQLSLPSHGKLEPDLHSGEIHVKFTADTPIFVSDGNGEFTRDSNGRYAIPGSSVRGLLRQNMQILGLGMLIPGEDFEDRQISSRQMERPKTLQEELPKNYQDAMTKGLDYPRAILGYCSDSSYRSRVSIGDFAVNGVPEQIAPCMLTLMEPKLSRNYWGNDCQLRGIKQYWLKEYTTTEKAVINPKILTQLKPLRKGTVFEGVIRFRNLHPDELGLLLWCIRLEEGCYQSLGMGKPYGLGRVLAEITQLREFSLTHPEHALYGSLCSGSIPASEDAIEGYLNSYWKYAFSAMHLKKKETVKDLPSIRDFFYLHRVILDPKQCCYMACKKGDAPLPTIRQFSEENPLPDNSRSEQDLPKIPEKKLSPAEQLAARFNAGNAVSSSSKGKRRK